MLDVIEIGSLQAPYKEFTITIPANGNKKLNYLHSTIEVIEASSQNFTVSLGGAEETTLQVGICYRYQRARSGNQGALPYVNFINRTNAAITLKVAFGAGEIWDHRQIGNVTISGAEDAPAFMLPTRPTDLKVTSLSVPAGGSSTFTPDANAIEWIAQNQGSDPVTLFGSSGVILPAGADFTANLTKAFSINNASASAVTVVVTEFLR